MFFFEISSGDIYAGSKDLNSGGKWIWGSSELNDSISGTFYNDVLNGNGGDDILNGNDGNDYMYGGDGNDTLYGGNGDDHLDGGFGFDYLDGGEGNDTYYWKNGYSYDSFIDSGSSLDIDKIVFRSSEISWFSIMSFTFNGIEKIISEKSLPTVLTAENLPYGINYDFSFVELENIHLLGSYYNDYIVGSLGNDFIYGYSGDDVLFGGELNDYLDGGSGDDILFSGSGSDQYLGGVGIDYLVFDYRLLNVLPINMYNFNLEENIEGVIISDWGYISQDAFGSVLDSDEVFEEIEGIYATNYNDYIIAEMAPGFNMENEIYGVEIFSFSGDDYVLGSNYNDYLDVGLGNNTVFGLSGDDYIIFGDDEAFSISNDINLYAGGLGSDTIILNYTNSIISYEDNNFSIEIINNNRGINSGYIEINKKDNNDILGVDIINSDHSNITEIRGSNFNDILEGSYSDDKLIGNDGDDVFFGLSGHDVLEGGLGSDSFVFSLLDEGYNCLTNITDFEQGKDQIIFEGISSQYIHILEGSILFTQNIWEEGWSWDDNNDDGIMDVPYGNFSSIILNDVDNINIDDIQYII